VDIYKNCQKDFVSQNLLPVSSLLLTKKSMNGAPNTVIPVHVCKYHLGRITTLLRKT